MSNHNIISQTPITVTYSLEEILKHINGKLDILQKGVKEDIKELKGSSKAQIWKLIGILIAAIGGFLVPVGRLVISGNP